MFSTHRTAYRTSSWPVLRSSFSLIQVSLNKIPPESTRYLAPTSSNPAAATWIAPGFDDAGWTSGASGLGFGLLVPGMLVKEVQTNFAMGSLAAVDAALAGTPNPPALTANTQIRQVLNLLGDGADGRFSTAPGTTARKQVNEYGHPLLRE